MEPKDKDEIMREMDTAAADAQNELVDLDQDAVELVADWWKRWYLKAGHKRLGRVLIVNF